MLDFWDKFLIRRDDKFSPENWKIARMFLLFLFLPNISCQNSLYNVSRIFVEKPDFYQLYWNLENEMLISQRSML